MTWTHCWREVRKYPRRTGMIWRGGVLWYTRPAGPPTLFQHVLNENLKMMYFSQREIFEIFSKNPLLATRKSYLPVHTGNTIQFFTYGIKEAL